VAGGAALDLGDSIRKGWAQAAFFRPQDVGTAGSVAALAADSRRPPGNLPGFGIETEVARVAFDAPGAGILPPAGPVERIAGGLLVVIGVLVFTDSLQWLSQYLTFLPVLG